jgi:hypothetical protein
MEKQSAGFDEKIVKKAHCEGRGTLGKGTFRRCAPKTKRATATANELLWCSNSYSITFQGGFKPIELQTAGKATGLSPSQAFALGADLVRN